MISISGDMINLANAFNINNITITSLFQNPLAHSTAFGAAESHDGEEVFETKVNLMLNNSWLVAECYAFHIGPITTKPIDMHSYTILLYTYPSLIDSTSNNNLGLPSWAFVPFLAHTPILNHCILFFSHFFISFLIFFNIFLVNFFNAFLLSFFTSIHFIMKVLWRLMVKT